MAWLLAGGAAVATFVGCGKPAQPPQTVSWYVEHPEEMRTQLAWCADDVPRQQNLQCLNAAAAKGRLHMGKMKDEPPLNWNTPATKKP